MKKKKDFKKLIPRRILLAFVIVIGIFMVYQIFIGNPFYDEVSPVWVYVLFFIMGLALLVDWIIKQKTQDNDKKEEKD